jgi:hypothetical protein
MPQGGEDWKSLFDGKTLDGWTPKIRGFPLGENYRDTFSVKDGAIVVSYDKYDQFGDASVTCSTTRRSRLTGCASNTASRPITRRIRPHGPSRIRRDDLRRRPERHGRRRQLSGFGGSPDSGPGAGAGSLQQQYVLTRHQRRDEWPVGHDALHQLHDPAGPNGVWNQFEVEVQPSGVVTQKVNGQTTIVYSAVQLDPEGKMANSKPLVAAAGGKLMLDGGTISLQSEGNPIEFRKIEILELN